MSVRTKKPKARNLLAVDAHFRKAGAIEPEKRKLPRKIKHKKRSEPES
jgi:hypothetical protein